MSPRVLPTKSNSIEPSAVAALKSLVQGYPAESVDLARFAGEERALIERVISANGEGRLGALENALADRIDGDQIIAQVLAAPLAAGPQDTSQARVRTTWSHAQLLDEQFPEQQWVVQGLVPDESLVVLAGKKKLGKSWLALQIAQAAAGNVKVLGRDVDQRTVLFIALEDGPRRATQAGNESSRGDRQRRGWRSC
jgi:hypothetical protein